MTVKIVTTESSQYVIDEENKEVIRLPGLGKNLEDPEVKVHDLRKDGEVITLHSIEVCEEGKPMILWLQVRDDNVTTYRITTRVISIEEK